MSTDTRHPQYDDATLQAAIDWACTNSATPLLLAMAPAVEKWDNQAPARLALARGLLARLPEPPPPTADGKTPGQVAFEAWGNELDEWHKSLCSNWQASASAVLAAFGGTGLEAAIARMESVSLEELWDIFFKTSVQDERFADMRAVRARLIASAREGHPLPIATLAQDQVQATPAMQAAADAVLREEMGQPAEIPWEPWHGGECPLKDEEVDEWQWRLASGFISQPDTICPSGLSWGTDDKIIAYRVTKWREGFGPAAVDWKAKYEEAQKEIELLKKTPLQQLVQQREREVSHWCDMHTVAAVRAEKAESELASIVAAAAEAGWNGVENSKDLALFIRYLAEDEAKAKADLERVTLERNHAINTEKLAHRQSRLSTLRPIAEAGEVPAGAVRIFAMTNDLGHYLLSENWHPDDTHFADIFMPEAKAPAVEAAEPEPAPAQPWQPAVGDVVRLKSGGPAMVVCDPEENGEFWCSWFFDGKLYSQDFPAACLVSAKEAKP